MARKYKRKSNGQFAGGGGSAGSTAKGGGTKGASSKPKAATKSSTKAKSLAGKRKKMSRKRKVLMFAAENPALVVGVVGMGLSATANARFAVNNATAARKVSNSTKFRNDMKAAARGLGKTTGSQGLKAARRSRKGVYKL